MRWYKRMKLVPKFMAVFAFVSILMVVVAIIGLMHMRGVCDELSTVYEDRLVPIKELAYIESTLLRTFELACQHIGETDGNLMAMDDLRAQIAEQDKQLEAQVARYSKANLTAAEESALKEFKDGWSQYVQVRDRVVSISAAGQKTEATLALRDVTAQMAVAENGIRGLMEISARAAEEATNEADSAFANAARQMLIVLVVSIAVAMGIGIQFARSIAVPLRLVTNGARKHAVGDLERNLAESDKDKVRLRGDEFGILGKSFDALLLYLQEMADTANRIADGDLTVEVTPKSKEDELGHALAKMIDRLRTLTGQFAEAAADLATSAEQLSSVAEQAGMATRQIAVTIQEVAKGAGDQTRAVTESAAVVSQMNRAIEQVTLNAQSVASSSLQAAASAKAGAETVERSVQAMGRIREVIVPAAAKVKELGERSSEIGNIVEVIDDIAEQTNLLALNAAIEAARAGEHGRGFAVVADEVRKLAERSSKATKEIAALIAGVRKGTEQAVAAMVEGAGEVEAGARLAGEAGRSLAEILRAIDSVNEQVQGISTAAAQMSAASTAVVKSTDNISSISEENAAAAEEVSASTEEMSAQVEEIAESAQTLTRMAADLRELVGRFKLGESRDEEVVMRRRQADWKSRDGLKVVRPAGGRGGLVG